jgi:3-deoxy-D-arabino-heptulosonate 7-phosphate (DAHP) synthase
MTENEVTQAGLSKPFEVRDNTGTIFMEIQKKQGTDGEYEVRSGTCKIEGKEYYINAYEKTTKTGKQILSLTFKPKSAPTQDVKKDSIPF